MGGGGGGGERERSGEIGKSLAFKMQMRRVKRLLSIHLTIFSLARLYRRSILASKFGINAHSY